MDIYWRKVDIAYVVNSYVSYVTKYLNKAAKNELSDFDFANNKSNKNKSLASVVKNRPCFICSLQLVSLPREHTGIFFGAARAR